MASTNSIAWLVLSIRVINQEVAGSLIKMNKEEKLKKEMIELCQRFDYLNKKGKKLIIENDKENILPTIRNEMEKTRLILENKQKEFVKLIY